jgi:hypothetical protein
MAAAAGQAPPLRAPLFIVDAFAASPFGGNPAAVVLLSYQLSDEERLRIAAEMNLSETAFVEPMAADGITGWGDGADGIPAVFRTADAFRLRCV